MTGRRLAAAGLLVLGVVGVGQLVEGTAGPVDPARRPAVSETVPAVVPDPAAPVRPYVASPEPPETVCARRGGCRLDTDPVRLYFRSCADVPETLKPLRAGEPGYRVGLDRDRDGSACDQ